MKCLVHPGTQWAHKKREAMAWRTWIHETSCESLDRWNRRALFILRMGCPGFQPLNWMVKSLFFWRILCWKRKAHKREWEEICVKSYDVKERTWKLKLPNACVLSPFSPVQLFVNPWTITSQVSLSVGFSRQEYWSGLPFPPSEGLPDSGIKPGSPALQPDFFPVWATHEAPNPSPPLIRPWTRVMSGLPSWSSGWESTYQCKGHAFNPWSRKIPRTLGQPQLLSLLSREPQLLSPQIVTNKPKHQKPTFCDKRIPYSLQLEKVRVQQWRPRAAKNK